MPVTVTKWIFLPWKPVGKMGTIASDKSHRGILTLGVERRQGTGAVSGERSVSLGDKKALVAN